MLQHFGRVSERRKYICTLSMVQHWDRTRERCSTPDKMLYLQFQSFCKEIAHLLCITAGIRQTQTNCAAVSQKKKCIHQRITSAAASWRHVQKRHFKQKAVPLEWISRRIFLVLTFVGGSARVWGKTKEKQFFNAAVFCEAVRSTQKTK